MAAGEGEGRILCRKRHLTARFQLRLRVHLACSTVPATATCVLATPVVNFSNTLSQEDTLTISTDSFTEKGRMVASPGHYKVTITATTMSGDRSQLTMPFEVKNGE